MPETYSVGVVGARGHTGSELLRLLAGHDALDVRFAGSREKAGLPVPQIEDLVFEDLDATGVGELGLDAVFLALPNGLAPPYVAAIAPETVVIDISADHRFDDDWVYGLAELNRNKISGARRIANPGCFATAAQLTIAPFLGDLAGMPVVFGVSGYSGAGTTPSPRNDPARLSDNLLPYSLVGHIHERESSRSLGCEVRFMPHVHPAFRGLLVTTHLPVASVWTAAQAGTRVTERYEGEPLIEVQGPIPELRDGANRPGVLIGGIAVTDDGRSIVVVAAEDNLLKGAAVQAVQNLNLALGLPELTGIL